VRVKEVFLSIQGESASAGLPTVFVRFAGCNLRCRYCDTQYAYTGGEDVRPEKLALRLNIYPYRRVCLTGGEPLLQPQEELQTLLDLLGHWDVSIETNGSLPLRALALAPGQRWVMDIKCPGSREEKGNRWENLQILAREDEIKFVLASREDYLWARQIVQTHSLMERTRVSMSPVCGELEPDELAKWILSDGLDVRLQLQLHKIIFGPEGEQEWVRGQL